MNGPRPILKIVYIILLLDLTFRCLRGGFISLDGRVIYRLRIFSLCIFGFTFWFCCIDLCYFEGWCVCLEECSGSFCTFYKGASSSFIHNKAGLPSITLQLFLINENQSYLITPWLKAQIIQRFLNRPKWVCTVDAAKSFFEHECGFFIVWLNFTKRYTLYI